jgi:Na+-translocating ferredoxin:NAD+ oxidoreductase RnfD subunit
MEWKKKKEIVWGCFAVASLITLVGIFVHPIIQIFGTCWLIGIMVFCATDKQTDKQTNHGNSSYKKRIIDRKAVGNFIID